jgi:thiol:disulfide interchange protein DsbA
MHKFSITLLLFLITLSLNAFSADNSQKYVQISNQKQTESDKIIVYEFFWSGCPHCYNLEPTINKIFLNNLFLINSIFEDSEDM